MPCPYQLTYLAYSLLAIAICSEQKINETKFEKTTNERFLPRLSLARCDLLHRAQ